MHVLCAGMYRACSTWQYEVIAHLLERHRGGKRLGYMTGEEFDAGDVSAEATGSWLALKSHEGHRGFARAVREGRARVVYAHRDIRDVVFSLMHKRGVSFEELVGRGMIHQVLVNDRFWSAQPGALTQRYEQLVASPESGILEIAAHLEIEIGPLEAAEISAEYSFQTNRRRTIELVNRLRDQGIDLDDPSNLQYYDQRTLLHWNHLREGRPGNWREVATPRQRAILARLCDPWLIAHGYEADTLASVAEAPSWDVVLRRELELARGWLACALRCAALEYPRSARAVKRLVGIPPEPPAAVPARTTSHIRVDEARPGTSRGAVPDPHFPGDQVSLAELSSSDS